MKDIRKRIGSCLFAIIFSFCLSFGLGEFSVRAAANHTQNEGISWANARGQENWCVDVDGSYGCQCVDLILAYYDYLVGYHVSGHATDYSSNSLPSGWTRVTSNPQAGDIIVWGPSALLADGNYRADSTYGHIGIITSVVNGTKVNTVGTNTYEGGQPAHFFERYSSTATCFIRPEWKNSIPDGKEMTSGYNRTLPDGDYLIVNAGEQSKTSYLYLDINGTAQPAPNETNVLLSGPYSGKLSGIDYEAWTLKYNSDGFYTITQKGTNKALDVYGANKKAGANVSVHDSNGSAAQKWAISYNWRNGYRLQAKCNGYSLDTGKIENGSNVYTYPGHDLDNQSWLFIPYKPSQDLENGRYIILSSVDKSKEIDLPGNTGNLSNGTQVSLWSSGVNSKYNAYDITKLSDGYYKIKNVASGKCLEIQYGASTRKRVSIYDDNGSISQQWAICKDTKNGGYSIRSKVSGMAIDLENASTENGAIISQYQVNGSLAESWIFVPAEYSIKYDCNGGKFLSGLSSLTEKKNYKEDRLITSVNPIKSDYTFLGWSQNINATTATYKAGNYYSVDKDIVLYAIWKRNACENHNFIKIENSSVKPTCTKDGKEADMKCTKCGYIKRGNTIKAKGHTLIIDKAVPATKTSTGLTEGSHCSVCKVIIKRQQIIPALGDKADNGIGTISSDGKTLTDTDNVKYSISGKLKNKDLKKNLKIADKKSGGKYKITKVIKKNGKVVGGNVTYMAPYNKNCTKATAGATVKLGGVSFKITALNANAFKNCKKLTQFKAGGNMLTIGKNAFNGCSSLKSVTITSTKLKSIGSNAFKGTTSKTKYKVPKSRVTKYTIMILKAGASVNSKISK